MDIREERKSLIKSAEKYIEAGQYGDIQLIKDVFHNHVTIFGYFEGEFLGGPFQLLYDLMEMTSSYAGKPVPDILVPPSIALEAARESEPDKQLSFMAFPENSFASPHHYTAFMQGNTALTSKLLKPVLIDAKTGRVTEKRDLPWYVSALLISQPLHFGDYGGIPLKILWALLDIASIVVLGSGVYLWLKKGDTSYENINKIKEKQAAGG